MWFDVYVIFYKFCGCVSDTLIEQAMNGTSVAEVFEHHRENFFRGKEVSFVILVTSCLVCVLSFKRFFCAYCFFSVFYLS